MIGHIVSLLLALVSLISIGFWLRNNWHSRHFVNLRRRLSGKTPLHLPADITHLRRVNGVYYHKKLLDQGLSRVDIKNLPAHRPASPVPVNLQVTPRLFNEMLDTCLRSSRTFMIDYGLVRTVPLEVTVDIRATYAFKFRLSDYSKRNYVKENELWKFRPMKHAITASIPVWKCEVNTNSIEFICAFSADSRTWIYDIFHRASTCALRLVDKRRDDMMTALTHFPHEFIVAPAKDFPPGPMAAQLVNECYYQKGFVEPIFLINPDFAHSRPWIVGSDCTRTDILEKNVFDPRTSRAVRGLIRRSYPRFRLSENVYNNLRK